MCVCVCIADDVAAAGFKQFYYAAPPLTGVAFIGSGYYAHWYLDGENAWNVTLLFAFFVALRVFDLCSDWGMWAITLASVHRNSVLRHVSLGFPLIGSLLMIADLTTMKARAKNAFNIEVKKAAYLMLAQVLLEDFPQMGITIAYFVDKDPLYFGASNDSNGKNMLESGPAIDQIAIISLVPSAISLLYSVYMIVQSLICIVADCLCKDCNSPSFNQ